MIPHNLQKPQERRKRPSPKYTFPLMGLFIGLLLFALFYGFIYFFLFRELGAVSPAAGIIGIVFAIAFSFIGGAIEYHYRSPRK